MCAITSRVYATVFDGVDGDDQIWTWWALLRSSTPTCLMISMGYTDVVVSNAVLVLKSLVQTQLQAQSSSVILTSSTQPPLAIISHLARRIDDIRHSQARACVLWLVGQYSEVDDTKESGGIEGIADWAPDVLRKTAKTFSNEVSRISLS